MNEQNKGNQNHGESPKNQQGEQKGTPSSWKRLLSKRWVYPAAYMAAAAIILTLVWVYQDTSTKSLSQDPATVSENVSLPNGETGTDTEAVEVIAALEGIEWPVESASDVRVVKPFFDENGTEENHEAAMIQYEDTFVTNTGIDLAREDNQTFEVRAALAGKVTRVEENPVLGTVIEIAHEGNLKTVYQSLVDPKVKQGDEVKKGAALANAGTSEFEKDLGNHVHFEVYDNGNLVNPESLLPKN